MCRWRCTAGSIRVLLRYIIIISEEFKMSKTRSIRWDKLDNTANLFPSIAGESMTNVYRISVTLTDEIDSESCRRHWI